MDVIKCIGSVLQEGLVLSDIARLSDSSESTVNVQDLTGDEI